MAVRVQALWGQPIRWSDCLTTKREQVEECVHIKRDQKLRKVLLETRDQAAKANPGMAQTVYCPLCSRAIDQYVQTEVIRATGEVPSKYPHIHVAALTGLSTAFLMDGAQISDSYLCAGAILWDGFAPCSNRILTVNETVKARVLDALTKIELVKPAEIGLYICASVEA